jgi:tetratricopeptide (TPR) repeat protein
MPRRSARRGLAELPQTEGVWHVAIHRLRVWVKPEDEEPTRPWTMLALNLDNMMIQHTTILPARPEPHEIADFLAEAMRRRDTSVNIRPHRPAVIHFEDAALVTALTPQLEAVKVAARQAARPESIKNILNGLEEHLRGGPEPKGLLQVRGVKPPLVGGLFAAAANFYRTAPWEQVSDRHVFAVEVPTLDRKQFVIIMGGAGMEYGLAVFEQWADVKRMFAPALDMMDHIPAKGAHAFNYNEITMVPFADLEAIEEHGWEVAGEDAHPVPMIFTAQGEARRPQRKQLQWYEATLRALPIFVREHLRPDGEEDFLPAEATIPVVTSSGEVEVRITYPGGVLPDLEELPAGALDWLGDDDEMEVPDRRAMEGVLGSLGASLGTSMGGGRKRGSVEQAQEIMYQAWEERRPARRIALARQALDISPDCADAYVLLAEEEARTRGEALALYEQGVAAGERALGKKTFQEDVGHFWGLIETRPYMRARAGLANTLWDLGRHEEARDHYRDLLRLNPGDNQGIRYSLLNLLLDMQDDQEASMLIKEYADDGMAEWVYTQALLAFRQQGAGARANSAVRKAIQGNPHVPAYLTGKKKLPTRLPPYIGFGDENEAIHYASGYLKYWRHTSGAVEWLKEAAK